MFASKKKKQLGDYLFFNQLFWQCDDYISSNSDILSVFLWFF